MQLYHNITNKNDYNASHEFDKNQTYQFQDGQNYKYGPLSVHGSFTVNGTDIVKGNHIHIGSIKSTVNRADQISALAISAQTDLQPTVTDKTGKAIGHIFAWNQDGDGSSDKNHQVDFYIDVTTDQKYVNQMNFDWSLPNAIIVDRDTKLYNWTKANTSKQNPYVDTIATSGGHKYIINVQTPTFNHSNQIQLGKTVMNAWARGDVGFTSYGDLGISHDQPNLAKASNGDFLYDLTKNTPSEINYTDGTFKRVLHLVGSNVPTDYTQFGVSGPINSICVFDENGKYVDQASNDYSFDRKNLQGTSSFYFSHKGLSNNLTPEQVLQQTPVHYVGFSKQQDGSWYIAWNLDNSDTTATTSEIENATKNSRYYLLQTDSKIKQKIIDNTLKINHDVLHDKPTFYMLRVFQPQPKGLNNNFSITDVTPDNSYNAGSASQVMITPAPAKTSQGDIQRSVSYEFVDDDLHGDIVGSIITKIGKTGDTVNPNMKVPDNYSLANGQNLPGNYVLKDNNSMIQVHLIHQKSNAPDITGTGIRIINFSFPASYHGSNPKQIKQTVTFKEHGYFDKVLNKNIYSDWQAEGSKLFNKVDLPSIAGYAAQVYNNDASSIPVATAVPNDKPTIINVSYKANPQKILVKFVDDDEQEKAVGDSITINGVTDANADFKDAIMAYQDKQKQHYDLASGLDPTKLAHVFIPDDSTAYTIHLKHHINDVKAENPEKSTRTIIIRKFNSQNQIVSAQTIIQQIAYYQHRYIDAITNETKSTKLLFDEKNSPALSHNLVDGKETSDLSYAKHGDNYYFANFKLPKLPGYTLKTQAKNKDDMTTYNVSYLAILPDSINKELKTAELANKLTINTAPLADLPVSNEIKLVDKNFAKQIAKLDTDSSAVKITDDMYLPVIQKHQLYFKIAKKQLTFYYLSESKTNPKFIFTLQKEMNNDKYLLTVRNNQASKSIKYEIQNYTDLIKVINKYFK